MRTLRDMNLSKLVHDDVDLFNSLIKDIFPNQEQPEKQVYPEIDKAIASVMKKWNLLNAPKFNLKIIQLYETVLVRHGFMLVGKSGVGKSTIKAVLIEASLEFDKYKCFQVIMNPKAITET